MSETGPGHQDSQETEFTAPKTGSETPDQATAPETPETPTNPLEPYAPRSVDERDVVLRNAQTYLYQHERGNERGSAFREHLGQKAFRLLNLVGAWTLNRGIGLVATDKQMIDVSTLKQSPLKRAFDEGTNPKKYAEILKEELKKDPDQIDMVRLRQNKIFNHAHEIAEKTRRLIDEKRRTESWNRQDEIDQELNKAYMELMVLAHTQSFEAELTGEEKEKIGKVDRGLKREAGETDAQWRQRAQKRKTVFQPKDIELRLPEHPQQLTGQRGRTNKQDWHQEWVGHKTEQEQRTGHATGYHELIKTEGKISAENLAELRNEAANLKDIIDILREAPAKELEERFGIRVTVAPHDSGRRYRLGVGKKAEKEWSLAPHELTLRLQDGSFVHFSVSGAGFIHEGEKGPEIVQQPSARNKNQFKEEEFWRTTTTISSPRGADGRPHPTLTFRDTPLQSILEGRVMNELQNRSEQAKNFFRDLDQRARERAAEEEAARQQAQQDDNPYLEDE